MRRCCWVSRRRTQEADGRKCHTCVLGCLTRRPSRGTLPAPPRATEPAPEVLCAPQGNAPRRRSRWRSPACWTCQRTPPSSSRPRPHATCTASRPVQPSPKTSAQTPVLRVSYVPHWPPGACRYAPWERGQGGRERGVGAYVVRVAAGGGHRLVVLVLAVRVLDVNGSRVHGAIIGSRVVAGGGGDFARRPQCICTPSITPSGSIHPRAARADASRQWRAHAGTVSALPCRKTRHRLRSRCLRNVPLHLIPSSVSGFTGDRTSAGVQTANQAHRPLRC